jgi:hypothetical protein
MAKSSSQSAAPKRLPARNIRSLKIGPVRVADQETACGTVKGAHSMDTPFAASNRRPRGRPFVARALTRYRRNGTTVALFSPARNAPHACMPLRRR